MRELWVIEKSSDGGQTWFISDEWYDRLKWTVYLCREAAKEKVKRNSHALNADPTRYLTRVTQYVPKE